MGRAEENAAYVRARAEHVRKRKLDFIARGLCAIAGAHGPAVRGQLCEACARTGDKTQRRKKGREEALTAETAQARGVAFWEAMQDLWFAGKLGMGR